MKVKVSKRAAVTRSNWVEAVENRLLLSTTVPALIPASAIGANFTGTIHLRYHLVAGIKGHSASGAISVAVESVTGNSIAGTATAAGETDAAFTGSVAHRSFDGVFADGATIKGTLSSTGIRLIGSLREVVNGQLITGSYTARSALAETSAKGKALKPAVGQPGTTINFQEGAGSSINAVNAVNSGSTESATAANGATVPVSLQSLDTSFTTPQSLNSQTTAQGVSSADETPGNANSGSISVSLPNASTPTTTSTSNAPNTTGVTQATTGDVTSVYAPTAPAVDTSYSASSYTITSIFGI